MWKIIQSKHILLVMLKVDALHFEISVISLSIINLNYSQFF